MIDRVEALVLELGVFLKKRGEAHYLLEAKNVYITQAALDSFSFSYAEAAALIMALGAASLSPTARGASAVVFKDRNDANARWAEIMDVRSKDDSFHVVYESDLCLYIQRLLKRHFKDDDDDA